MQSFCLELCDLSFQTNKECYQNFTTDWIKNLSHMQKLGSTNGYRMMLFFTTCDFPSITAQAFPAILAASKTSSYLDVAKYY